MTKGKSGKKADISLHDDVHHYPQTELRWLTEEAWMPASQALLCRHAASEAIVFIHGWNGNAAGTWEAFPEFVGTMREASRADIFFLSYPSTVSQVPFCSSQLRRFLFDLSRDPVGRIIHATLPFKAPSRGVAGRYRRLFIVAHSMGAVVARRALIDLHAPPPDGLADNELQRFRLLFFAPAHSGSEIPLLIGSGMGLDTFLPGAKLLGSLVRYRYQSLRDLEVGSPFLVQLAGDCKELRERLAPGVASTRHLRATVYHAHNDRVVSQNSFDFDPPFHPVLDRNHQNICKPDRIYTTPVEALRAIFAL